MPVTSCHDILVTPHAEFCGNTFVFRQVSVEVIDGVKGIVFVFSVDRILDFSPEFSESARYSF